MECLFCKVANRELGEIVWEDESVFVIVDIGPLSPGHFLVIPKGHFPMLTDLPDGVAASIMLTIRDIIRRLGIKKYNILQNNGHLQSVEHVHFHIIPAYEGEGKEEKNGLAVNWKVSPAGKEKVPFFITEYKKKLLEMKK